METPLDMNFISSIVKPKQQQEERILFLYSSPSGGHKKCADAVRQSLESICPSVVQTIGIDAITYLYPTLGPIIAKTYLEILRYTPQIWDFLYDNPDIEEITRELRQLFNFLNTSKLKFLLTEYRPTALVCTHAIPCGVVAEQKKRGNCNLPLIAIATDFAVHSYWIYPEVDLYLVANHESKNTLLARNIPKEKIYVTGIPIDPAFSKKIKSHEAKKKLELDPQKPVIMIMGGARGLGPIKKITKEILSLRPMPQIVIITGMNYELEKGLSHYKKFKNIQIHGHVRNIPLLMDAADLLITKPGGLTSSESLVKGLPMILVNPIPGQEERNAQYLLKNGAAMQVREIRELKETIKQLFNHPAQLKQLSEKSKKISMPHSAIDGAKEIISLLDHLKAEKQTMKHSQETTESRNENVSLFNTV